MEQGINVSLGSAPIRGNFPPDPQVPWSVENIRARIVSRLGELGLTMEDLPSSVRKGVSAKTAWAKGPTIATLRETADRLRMSVPELLGAPAKETECDERALATAIRVAMKLLVPADETCPLRSQPEVLAELASKAYQFLMTAARERPDHAYSEDAEPWVAIHVLSILSARVSQKR